MPCIPWSGTGVDEVVVDSAGIVTVQDSVYEKGCTKSWRWAMISWVIWSPRSMSG